MPTINERALEIALRYKEPTPGTEITVLSMGPDNAATMLRKLLSMGLDSAILVDDATLAGSDMVQTARVLAAAIRQIGPGLVLAGNESIDGRGGIVADNGVRAAGPSPAARLDNLDITSHSVSGTAQVDKAVLTLESDLPAVLSVSKPPSPPTPWTARNT